MGPEGDFVGIWTTLPARAYPGPADIMRTGDGAAGRCDFKWVEPAANPLRDVRRGGDCPRGDAFRGENIMALACLEGEDIWPPDGAATVDSRLPCGKRADPLGAP